MPDGRRSLVFIGALLSLAIGCGGRTIATEGGEFGGTEGSDETGSSLSCEGPNAPTKPVLLVAGAMLPGPFVRVGERMYWADAWDEWSPAQPSVTLYRAQLDQPEDWVAVGTEQPRINQIVSDGEDVYWIVEGLAQPGGELLRAGPDDVIERLDEGLHGPRALTLGDGGEWIYYADSGALDEPGAKILRVRSDGSDRQVLADSLGQVTDVAVDDQHVWWTVPINNEVWRVGKHGDGPELVAKVYFPSQIEVAAGFAWTIGFSALYRIEPGVPPHLIAGYNGPAQLAVTETHLYFPHWNSFEDNYQGWIHRYPLTAGDYEPFAGEFVIDKTHPKPSTVRADAHAIYWATADPDEGNGAIWMLCKSAL